MTDRAWSSWPGRRARAVGLFVAGVLVFADYLVVAWIGWAAVLLMLLAIGFVEGRLRAVLWAFVLVGSAFVADVFWQLGWGPFDRSAEYEAIPQTPFVVIGVPLLMAVVAVGVGLRALWRLATRRGRRGGRRVSRRA